MNQIRPAMTLVAVLTLLTGIVYPLLITGVGAVAFHDAASGSVIVKDRMPVGSRLIGQQFTEPRYFWGRPSATASSPYNALASGGSNMGPLNPALIDAVRQRIAALRSADPANTAPIPVDLVTASASGLDPHISIAAARYQAARVAAARGLTVDEMRALIATQSHPRWLGVFGEPVVNVLELNLALDELPRR